MKLLMKKTTCTGFRKNPKISSCAQLGKLTLHIKLKNKQFP